MQAGAGLERADKADLVVIGLIDAQVAQGMPGAIDFRTAEIRQVPTAQARQIEIGCQAIFAARQFGEGKPVLEVLQAADLVIAIGIGRQIVGDIERTPVRQPVLELPAVDAVAGNGGYAIDDRCIDVVVGIGRRAPGIVGARLNLTTCAR